MKIEIETLTGMYQLNQHNNVLDIARQTQQIAMFLSLIMPKIFVTLEKWEQATT